MSKVSLAECFSWNPDFLRVPLVPGQDKFVFLQNGSLVYYDEMTLLTQKQFCVEAVDDEGDVMTVPLICVPKSAEMPAVLYYIYSAG